MWASQNYLQQAGIGITGVHVEGRHFFMHPRDTFGLMLELTDDRLPGDPRNGLSPTGGGDGLVQVSGVAHVTAVVVDLDPVAALLAPGVRRRTARRVERRSRDHRRLRHRRPHRAGVAPHDASSEWHAAIANGRGTLHSVTLAVDLDTAPAGTRSREHRHRTRGARVALARPRRHLRDPAPARRSGVTRPPGGGMLV